MTRLRLAPSSPKRMAELIRKLYRQHAAGMYPTSIYVTKADTKAEPKWVHAATRGARLLIHWHTHGTQFYQWASDTISELGKPSIAHYYREAWHMLYPKQHWPPDGDERLREELDQ